MANVTTTDDQISVLYTLRYLVLIAVFAAIPVNAQKVEPPGPVVVQPGAPGKPSRRLPASTKGVLPPQSAKNIEFMRGMIMHHSQAIEMTALIESRTKNKDLVLIGERIRKSQADEMLFMKRWLESQGELVAAEAKGESQSHGHHSAGNTMLMPGMLSPRQMEELRKASGVEFDRLFLAGMIQHHEGALVMVKDLFDTPGAGQDAELFNFAADVDTGQRAEIRSMQTLLNKRT